MYNVYLRCKYATQLGAHTHDIAMECSIEICFLQERKEGFRRRFRRERSRRAPSPPPQKEREGEGGGGGGGGGEEVNEILIENVWMELYVNMEIFILKNIKKTPYVTHKHNGILDRHLKDVSKHAKLRRVTVVFHLFLSYDRMVTPSCHIDHALYCTRSVWSIINTCDNSNKVQTI